MSLRFLIAVPMLLAGWGACAGDADALATVRPAADAEASLTADATASAAVDQACAFLPDPAARVNGKAISARQVKEALPPRLVADISAGRAPSPAVLRQAAATALAQLVDQELLRSASQRDGFLPDAAEGERRVAAVESRAGAAGFRAGLAGQGLTREEFVQRLASQAAVQRWMEQRVLRQIKVTDAEVRARFAEEEGRLAAPRRMHAAQILIQIPPAPDAEQVDAARRRADEIVAALRAGADFGATAAKHSACPSAPHGGELGILTEGETVPAFDAAAFALAPGEISEPVRTSHGFHIVKCIDRIPPRPATFEEVREVLRKRIELARLNALVEKAIAASRTQAEIEILLHDDGRQD